MGLRSMLLKGDPALEACLIRDSAHILLGAAGPHVGKIQIALLQLDGLGIAPGELAAQLFGLTVRSFIDSGPEGVFEFTNRLPTEVTVEYTVLAKFHLAPRV